MNITALKAALKSKDTVSRIRKAIYNTSVLGWSVDHVPNRQGKNFLAVRVRDGKLEITDRKFKNVTQLIVTICQNIKMLENKKISAGLTFFLADNLYCVTYQVISDEIKNPVYLCENVLDESDKIHLTRAEIIKL